MSAPITILQATGQTLNLIFMRADGAVWTGSSWQDPSAATLTAAAISLPELNGSGVYRYSGTIPGLTVATLIYVGAPTPGNRPVDAIFSCYPDDTIGSRTTGRGNLQLSPTGWTT